MLSFISPLDKSYISLRRAAALIASEMPGAEPDEIMEMFKYAIFSREFEREEIAVNERETCEAINLPILRIESPPPFNAPVRLSPEQQPHDLFAVKAMTVAEVLSERDGLPGEGKAWTAFADSPADFEAKERALDALARIPYAAFPAKGKSILDGILLARTKLRAWMTYKHYDIPTFLQTGDGEHGRIDAASEPVSGTLSNSVNVSDDDARGRPRKAGWDRLGQVIRDMHTANPGAKHSALAFEARKLVAQEFDEKDLPSVQTLLRQMKRILEGRG